MYYEFYIDQFFLEHLFTGCLLIATAAMLRRQRLSWKRAVAGGTVNAAAMTAFVCLGLPGWYFLGLLLAGAVVFAGKGREEFLKGLFFLLLTGVCFGGVLEALLRITGLPLAAGTVLALFLLNLAGRSLAKQRVLQDSLVTVQLQWEDRTETIGGIIDTGNRLEEPLTGRPVSVIDASAAKRLLGSGWEERRGFYLIPYHSIGTGKGWMCGVTIDRMSVKLSGNTTVVKRPVLAIYDGQVSVGEQFQMILHPLHARPEK